MRQQLHSGPQPQSGPTGPPPRWQVIATASGAVVAMALAVYFAGHELLPLALVGTSVFVGLGGLSFELARRRARVDDAARR